MDYDTEIYQTRSGRRARRLILIPDANVSDAPNESCSDSDDDQLNSIHSDDENYDIRDDDEDIEAVSPISRCSTIPRNSTYKWTRHLRHIENVDVQWKGKFSDPPVEKEPIEYFYQFFSHEVIQHIVSQTNIYATEKASSFYRLMWQRSSNI